MKNELIANSARFVFLVLLQALLLNNIALFGYIVPYLYILFILRFPIGGNRSLLLGSSFLLGLSIDIFLNSGGVHAAACVCMAYCRPFFLKTSFGVSYQYNVIKIKEMPLGGIFTYVLGSVLVHHLVLFTLEIFSTDHILLILKSTLFTVIFSSFLILITFVLIGAKKR